MLDRSGIGVYLQNILPNMGALSETFAVHIHGSKKPLIELTQQNNLPFVVHDIPTEPYHLKQSILPLGNQLSLENLWVPHYNIPWRGVRNLVVTVHDILHIRTDIIPRNLLQTLYAKHTFAQIKKTAKSIIFVSAFSKAEFEGRFGVHPSSYVVHNGIAKSWANLSLSPPNKPYTFPYLFFIGSAMKHKNLSFLIDSYQEISSVCRYDLVIAGRMSGLRTRDMHPILQGNQINDRIHVLGGVSQEHLESLMFHAAALVFPSLYEGFGLPPLEALACGTPAIVSDIPVHREVFGDSVMYFDPHINQSLKNVIMNLHSKVAQHLPKQYSWQQAAAETTTILTKTTSPTNPSSSYIGK